MNAGNGRYQGDEVLLVKFFTNAKLNHNKTRDEGRPIYTDVPYISIMQPGNKDSIVIRPATSIDRNRFPEHFRKFEARESQEANEGMPLEEWTGITRSQCAELRFFNILTVEQLSNVTDSNAQNMMGINMLKTRAIAYIKAAKETATDEKFDELQAKYDDLVARFDAMGELEEREEAEEA